MHHLQDCLCLSHNSIGLNQRLFVMLLIYASTTWLSIQNFSAAFLRFNSFLIKQTIFEDKTTVNFSLGIDKYFFGKTLDSPTNKLQCISPSWFNNCLKLHGPNPFSETSKKWWSPVSTFFPNKLGCIHLGMCRYSTPFDFYSHLSKSFLNSEGFKQLPSLQHKWACNS